MFKNDTSTSVEVPFGAFVRPTSKRQVRRIKDYIKMKIRQSPECHDDCHCPVAEDDLASNVDSDKHLVVASGSVSQPLRASAVSHNCGNVRTTVPSQSEPLREKTGSAIIADASNCEGIDKVMFKGQVLYDHDVLLSAASKLKSALGIKDKGKDTGKESDESGTERTMVREPESYGDGSARGRARMMKDLGAGFSSFLDDDDDDDDDV